jgi:hypothetical protein
MPRIATIPSTEVTIARRILAAYLATPGNSEMKLFRLSKVPQYTISKFHTGKIKSLTPDVKNFLRYADNGIKRNIKILTKDPRILQALDRAWDRTDAGVALLANTIHALAPIIRGAQPKA